MDDAHEKKMFERARKLGMNKGEAMKFVNKQGEVFRDSKKMFEENFEREHGVKPAKEATDNL